MSPMYLGVSWCRVYSYENIDKIQLTAIDVCDLSRPRLRNPGKDISFPIFIRKEIKPRKLEQKSKQQISRLNDLLNRLNDITSR